jgi:hypothetical protein
MVPSDKQRNIHELSADTNIDLSYWWMYCVQLMPAVSKIDVCSGKNRHDGDLLAGNSANFTESYSF